MDHTLLYDSLVCGCLLHKSLALFSLDQLGVGVKGNRLNTVWSTSTTWTCNWDVCTKLEGFTLRLTCTKTKPSKTTICYPIHWNVGEGEGRWGHVLSKPTRLLIVFETAGSFSLTRPKIKGKGQYSDLRLVYCYTCKSRWLYMEVDLFKDKAGQKPAFHPSACPLGYSLMHRKSQATSGLPFPLPGDKLDQSKNNLQCTHIP